VKEPFVELSGLVFSAVRFCMSRTAPKTTKKPFLKLKLWKKKVTVLVFLHNDNNKDTEVSKSGA